MGAQASKPDSSSGKAGQDVTLSQSLLNKLSPSSSTTKSSTPRQDIDTSSPSDAGSSSSATPASQSSVSSPSPSPPTSHSITDSILPSSRQQHLDSSVRSAISSELSRLRKQEADVTAKIQAALKEENLAIEKKWSGGGGSGGEHTGRSAHALQKELDAVKEKINRHNESRKAVENTPGVKEARERVVQCYKKDNKRTLDCYAEVRGFVDAVEQAEKNFIASLK